PSIAASRDIDPAQLKRALKGDLDWIVMKALEKDRTRRYDTASGLARDIQHYLADELVEACPPSAWYRLRKFARRNQRVAIMASFLFALLVISVAVLGVSYAQVQAALHDKTTALEGEREALREKTGALERERQTSYYQNIALAERQLSAGNVGRAEELLDDCSSPLRGWEWHFLKRQRFGNALPLKHSTHPQRVAFSPDGRQIASGCFDGTIQVWDAETGSVLHPLQRGDKDG